MGSSSASDLHRGRMNEWETKLQQAITLIREVAEEVSDGIGSDGQYDNAGEDGALVERLYIASGLIKEALPPEKP